MWLAGAKIPIKGSKIQVELFISMNQGAILQKSMQ